MLKFTSSWYVEHFRKRGIRRPLGAAAFFFFFFFVVAIFFERDLHIPGILPGIPVNSTCFCRFQFGVWRRHIATIQRQRSQSYVHILAAFIIEAKWSSIFIDVWVLIFHIVTISLPQFLSFATIPLLCHNSLATNPLPCLNSYKIPLPCHNYLCPNCFALSQFLCHNSFALPQFLCLVTIPLPSFFCLTVSLDT